MLRGELDDVDDEQKDFEVYTEHGYAVTTGGDMLRVRLNGEKTEAVKVVASLPEDERDSVSYLRAVVRGKLKPAGLSSLENNMIVVEILEAARNSVSSGKSIRVQ